MKEFLILKKANASVNDLNCAVKIISDEVTSTLSGEIYCFKTVKNGFSVYLKTSEYLKKIPFSSGLKFSAVLPLKDLSDGFLLIVLDSAEIAPLLYINHNANYDFLDVTRDIKSNVVYDDEQIALSNYYEGENFETKRIYNHDNDGACEDKKSPPENTASNETLLHENVDKTDENGKFYASIKERLDKIIYCHQKDYELSRIISNGEFVKINYDQEKYYLVGRIFEGCEVKYICYAVKGEYDKAPKELEPYCKFIPLSPYSPLSVGYYVIFQSASDGKVISN